MSFLNFSFNCKLCDCKFNDPNAKEMHMKGRRHRLQYKKKVNPDLVVDIKPTARQKKMAEERAKRTMARGEDFWRRREEEFRQMEEEERAYFKERRIFEEEFPQPPDFHEMMRHYGGPGNVPGPRNMRGFGGGSSGPMVPPGFFVPPMMRRPETIDDRHVIAKHSDIYPGDDALAAIQKHVSLVEKALKGVSDSFGNVAVKNGVGVNGNVDDKQGERILKGVMRVGVLAKGLLLKGDSNIQLVLLCSQHPTSDLLHRVIRTLPAHLGNTDGVKYDIRPKVVAAAIVVNVKDAIPLEIEITLTSPVLREAGNSAAPSPTPAGALNKDKCLEALAALRQAKWFQARAATRQSCVMIIRILRDLCSREPSWKPVKLFLLELLTERVLASAPVPLPPGDALRRIFEAISGGILLPESPGFLDPCEKTPRDVAEGLTPQERENLTSSAQSFLRLMAFRQVHDVLQMDPLPQPRFQRGKVFGRKRGPDDDDDECDGAAKQIKLENDDLQ
jgi:zinc finger RNA-binding protein